MIDIFADKLIELLKTRQDNKEKLFMEFVQPAYDAFEKAHQEYLDCFYNYKEYLYGRTNLSDQEIMEFQKKLKNDSLFQYHIRNSAIEEAEVLINSRRYDFAPFINAIRHYFQGSVNGNSKMIPIIFSVSDNEARATLFAILHILQFAVSNESIRANVSKEGLDEIIRHIQDKRRKVHKEFLNAKKYLLQM